MPNFDGKGPLKRGRVIGRGRGPCKENTPECPREDTNPDTGTTTRLPQNHDTW